MTLAINATPLILVVDDNDAGRFAKSGVLRRAGFQVIEAATGAEALAAAAKHVFDVVLLDVNLPDINGMDVCRQLKAAPGVPAQVLQISATAIDDADRVEGLAQGADTYLIEPVAPEILVATTRALLRVGRTERALFESAARERAAREEAERANRSKDEFLATLSHELRSPLNAMSGWLWQVQRQPDDPSLRVRAFEAMDRNLKMQARLIDDLLDISRIEKGKVDLALRVIDLRSVVFESFEALRGRAEGRTLDVHLPAGVVPVLGDRQRLGQVVDNLLNNARQFTPAPGRIGATLEATAGHAVLTVTDSGAGIDAAFLPFVFDSFSQAAGGASRRKGGLGLGLAIVKRLVELHGGSVQARSDGRGLGAAFIVRLPIVDQAQAAASSRDEVEIRLHGVSILLVEDDVDARELMNAMLRAAGAEVTSVTTAASALAAIEMRSFDVVVSDIAMPDGDGLELMRAIRARGVTTPSIAVTALSAADDRRRTRDAGFNLHLPKPIDQPLLVRSIASLLPT